MTLSLGLRGDAKAQEIPTPEYVLANVIDELILKDHYEYTINLQEQIIAVYRRNEYDNMERIKVLQLTVDEYKVIIKAMEDNNLLTEEQVKECNQHLRKEKRRSFWNGVKVGIPTGLALALVLILL